MKPLLFGLLFLPVAVYGQAQNSKLLKPLTARYAGIYAYGTTAAKGSIGSITVYPETDSTILFYIDLNTGAPSYHMGALYGRVKVIQDTGTFYTKLADMDDGCKWGFKFSKKHLDITTIDGQFACGFGYGVYSDELYIRKSDKVPDHFIEVGGRKLSFKSTTPEDYNKD